MTIFALGVCLFTAPTSAPALANAYDPTLGWQTKHHALICSNYFAINDGEAAVRAGDGKWLNELDCLVVNGGLKLTIIQDAPFNSDTDIWRARLHLPGGQDKTIYLRAYNAGNFANAGNFKTESAAKIAYDAMVKGYGSVARDAFLAFHYVNNTLLIGPGPYRLLADFCQKTRREGGTYYCEFPRPNTKHTPPPVTQTELKNLERKHSEPAAFDALLKGLTTEHTADEPSRPKPKAAAPSSQPMLPLVSQPTARENGFLVNLVRQQLYRCWNLPGDARDAKELNVQIRASVNPDGTVRSASIIEHDRMTDPLVQAAAESARRTFFNPQCTPLKLPADQYGVWKELIIDFDPKHHLP